MQLPFKFHIRRGFALAVATVTLAAGALVATQADAITGVTTDPGACQAGVFTGTVTCAGMLLPADGSMGRFRVVDAAGTVIQTSTQDRWIGLYQLPTTTGGTAEGWCISDPKGHPVSVSNPHTWNLVGVQEWQSVIAAQLLLMRADDGTFIWRGNDPTLTQDVRGGAGWLLGHSAAHDIHASGFETVPSNPLVWPLVFSGPAAIMGQTALDAFNAVANAPGVWTVNATSTPGAGQVSFTGSVVDGNGNPVPDILVDLDTSDGGHFRGVNGTVAATITTTVPVTGTVTSAQWDPVSGPQVIDSTNPAQQDLMGLTNPVLLAASSTNGPVFAELSVAKLVDGVQQGGGFTFEVRDAAGAVVDTVTTDATGETRLVTVAPSATYTIHEIASGDPMVLVNPNPVTVTADALGVVTPAVAGVVAFSDVRRATGSTQVDDDSILIVDDNELVTIGDTFTITGSPGRTADWSMTPHAGDGNQAAAVCTAANQIGATASGTVTFDAAGTAVVHATWQVTPDQAGDYHLAETLAQPADGDALGSSACAAPGEFGAWVRPLVSTQASGPANLTFLDASPVPFRDTVNAERLQPAGDPIFVRVTAHFAAGINPPLLCTDPTFGAPQTVQLVGDATGNATGTTAPFMWTPTPGVAGTVHFGEEQSADGITWTPQVCGRPGESLPVSVVELSTRAVGPASGVVVPLGTTVSIHDDVTARGLQPGTAITARVQAREGMRADGKLTCDDPKIGPARDVQLVGSVSGAPVTASSEPVQWTATANHEPDIHFGETATGDGGTTWTVERCGQPGENFPVSVPIIHTTAIQPTAAAINALFRGDDLEIVDTVDALMLAPGGQVRVVIQPLITGPNGPTCDDTPAADAQSVIITGNPDHRGGAMVPFTIKVPAVDTPMHFVEHTETLDGTLVGKPQCGQNPDESFIVFKSQRVPGTL